MALLSASSARVRLAWRRFGAVVCGAALLMQVGCYSYLPLQEQVPPAGQIIGLTLNDRGRVMVADQLGESIERVSGLLVANSETSVTLEVARTRSLRGVDVTWTGERVQIPREGIRGYQQRQFSRGRTALFVVGAVVGVVLVGQLFGLDVFGRGAPIDNGGCGTDCNQQ